MMEVRSVNGPDPAAQVATLAARAAAARPHPPKNAARDATLSARPGSDKEIVQPATPQVPDLPVSERSGTRLHVDEASKRIVAEIINRQNEVVKQIPPEELLKIAARFRDLQAKLFDAKV